MKVLITGASGYIGGYLFDYLSLKGFDPIFFDKDINKVNKLPDCSLIIHCAGRKPKLGVTIDDFIYSNVTANQKLSELAVGIPIIYLSTMAVYSLTPYGITKLLGEQILEEKHGHTTVIRLPRIINQGGDGDTTRNLEDIGKEILDYIKENK
jgi:nucleoside-diphosphate-sugar epimerase